MNCSSLYLNTFCNKYTSRLFHSGGFSIRVRKNKGASFPWRLCTGPVGQSLCRAGSAGQAAEDECVSPSCRPSHRTRISTELLTVKAKGYFTTDYKYLKPEQMSGCLTAKDSPLAQPPVLPSIFLIWQDHGLQPHLIPFLCISFL